MRHNNVLLVESDTALRGEVARLLFAEDLDVTQTNNSEAAFRLVASNRFDVIISNVTAAIQPGGTGLLELLRDHQTVIFVSPAGEVWHTRPDHPEQIILRGPFTITEFATCIADAVRKALHSVGRVETNNEAAAEARPKEKRT